MKKFTSILLFTVLMIPANAQYDYHKQALKTNSQFQGYLTEPFSSGTPTIKLDSVISTTPPIILQGPFTTPIKEIYEYDSNARLSMITEKAWHPEKKVFGIIGKKVFFYNAEGLVDSISFNINGLTMKGSYKYTYDNKGKLEIFHIYSFDFGKWYNAAKMVYSYNDLGKISEIKYFEGNSGYIGQVATFKFTYNEAGKLIEYKRISSWQDFVLERTVYEWNSEGKVISELNEEFIFNDNSKIEHSYNVNGDRIKSKYFSETNSGWLLNGYKEFTYCDLNCTDMVNLQNPRLYYFGELEFGLKDLNTSTKVISEEIAQFNGTQTEKTKYYYSPVTKGGTTGVNNINIADVIIYPNPATDQVIFSWNGQKDQLNLKMFDVTGACVLDREILSGVNISVKNLQNGMYMYRLTNGNQFVKSGKLMVE